MLCLWAAAYPFTPQHSQLQVMYGRHSKAVQPHAVITAQYLILLVSARFTNGSVIPHGAAQAGGRVWKNGKHKSPRCCDPSPTVTRAELQIGAETCLKLTTALCRLVSLMLRIFLSGGLKFQPSVVNGG